MSMPSSAPKSGSRRLRSPRYSRACERQLIGQQTSPISSWYGAEAVLPTDQQYGSPRVQAYQLEVTKKPRGTPSTYSKKQGTPLL
jgi:hypothetical protein